MEFLKLPFFQRLESSQRVLLTGAGGGFDIFCGLPLYFALRKSGKEVHLANLSFSALSATKAERLSPVLFKVDADTVHSNDYFPEVFLSSWLRETEKLAIPIYCFEQSGVQPLVAGYKILAEKLNLDTIILIDGGTDSLMRGDEVSLGTPQEDIASITAVSQVEVRQKLLACLGVGVDSFHGVCHAHFFEAVSEITKQGGYLGALSLSNEMPEVLKYRDASRTVFKLMPSQPSIVNNSILDAIDGNFGNYHSTDKTAGGELWINPMMPIYWFFNLQQVVGRVLYLDWIEGTETFQELGISIENFRKQCRPVRPWKDIPI